MKEYAPVKEGKVREIYDLGDALVMRATDRISAFDVILKNKVNHKGTVLTKMSAFWFDLTKDIIPNHMISTDVKDMPEFFRSAEFDGNSMLCRKLTMLPIECIVRGYITGSGWASYQKNGTVCGIELPSGLQECEKLPEPIYTPSTKAEIGDHDENISFEQSVDVLEKIFPGKGREYAEQLRDNTIALYKKCADYALSRGIIIADTKFEFGLNENGEVVLGDEMLTPDSSRFWPLAGYEKGHGQPSFDKQFVRDWLKANPDSDYRLPQDVIDKTIAKYLEAYERLTGTKLLVPCAIRNMIARRSCRSYTDEEVLDADIDLITKAGTYAPSGMGRQSGRILVVKNKEIRDRLSKLNAAVMNADMDPFYGAPVVATVLADKAVGTYLYDGSLVIGNMLNAASALGLGSCWIHRAKEVFASPEGKQLLADAGIEGDYEGIGFVILGHPAGEKPAAKERKNDFVCVIE